MRLWALAPAKVNLCLFLGGLREDARHELVTLFESVSLADALSLTTLPAGSSDEVICAGVEGLNLAAAALELLRAAGWTGPPVSIEIDKRIPVAAGLGGGSADAAAVLRLANELEPVAGALRAKIATGLGADVPSQLIPGLVLGTGAGDRIARRARLAPHSLVIAPLSGQLSTADVYAEADQLELPRKRAELDARLAELESALARPGARPPAHLLINDLEPASRSLCPAIGPALQAVRDAGADQALVCGSGPTVAGIYWGRDRDERAAVARDALGCRFPRATVAHPVDATFGSVRPA